MFAAQPAKNSAAIAAKTKFFIFSHLIKCLAILSNLSFINRVKFERAAKWIKFKGRSKFDAPATAKRAKFLSLAAFFTDFKIISFPLRRGAKRYPQDVKKREFIKDKSVFR